MARAARPTSLQWAQPVPCPEALSQEAQAAPTASLSPAYLLLRQMEFLRRCSAPRAGSWSLQSPETPPPRRPRPTPASPPAGDRAAAPSAEQAAPSWTARFQPALNCAAGFQPALNCAAGFQPALN